MTPQRCAVIDGRLVLDWADSHLEFDGITLRRNCRCAECRSIALNKIAASPNPLSEESALAEENTFAENTVAPHHAMTILAASPLGYGVQLHFSDGHNRGVFPWSYLASLGR